MGSERETTDRGHSDTCARDVRTTCAIDPKKRAYPEETRELGLVLFWGKRQGVRKVLELDELYWFIVRKSRIHTYENRKGENRNRG